MFYYNKFPILCSKIRVRIYKISQDYFIEERWSHIVLSSHRFSQNLMKNFDMNFLYWNYGITLHIHVCICIYVCVCVCVCV